MPRQTEEQHEAKKIELMEKCYMCFAENGLHGTGIRKLAEYCGVNTAVLYTYFENLDDLIVECTEYCMSKVEDDFMAIAPKDPGDVERFLNEAPKWTAEKHGKKYRMMYQVYTHPKYLEYGKKFFEGVNQRYSAYAEEVAKRVGIPAANIRPMIFIFVRAVVHYALFEDAFYLQDEIGFLKQAVWYYTQSRPTHDKMQHG